MAWDQLRTETHTATATTSSMDDATFNSWLAPFFRWSWIDSAEKASLVHTPMEVDEEMPVNRNRDSVDVVAEILGVCRKPSGRTQVMYSVNLDYRRLVKFLEFLTEKGFLRLNGRKYEVTESGMVVLTLYERLREMLK